MSTRNPDESPSQRAPAAFGAFVRKPAARRAVAAEAAPGLEPVAAGAWPDDTVEIGAIVDAYGLKGWVKIAAHANAGQGGDALKHAKRWWLENGRERKLAIVAQAKPHSDTFVAQIAGVTDRDEARALRGYRVHVRRADFPALGADEFYWVDLVGLDVVNEAGVALGRVTDLLDNGAHSVLRVEYPSVGKDGLPSKGERLIPFVGAYVKTVDQAAKRIVVDWQADY
ncbi:ribosome maturation factor RimM [Trinickia caryophylli]|uniref:Ribosome maturation factor RimM n=1 Tax=Trinickia caryophylli TaxID=28094 RepID=A0A1X7DTN2_TRICW|nr:ribosome maturation factor RimM [Trinickia caryophylli]PMS08774.1 ribosome maturation factor RimM [Trinickia caryophylli]TRX18041.1 ribosome maturation factor RimM [Trinickia caryophylli]WQE11176.1 ribosome maturation factor RimM [Trinickia caryophylli]SMF21260.1 16S rRNA processing protein RimM [Trinickia caryophylli]GLU32319.1 ribosome maturation factor RimM [Trinickia caryophylli]